MNERASNSGELLDRASRGDASARQQLLVQYRGRLRHMVALRLDRRMCARVDPSDVVQEAMAEACQHLDEYLNEPVVPFYPWLRRFAWERLIQLHRTHIEAQRRSVSREAPQSIPLPDHSATYLVDRLLASGTSPSRKVMRDELRDRVAAMLAEMAPRDREVLVLRYLEQLSTSETAAVLGLTEGAVKVRNLRALKRLRGLLDGERSE
jgi:RNA polymerase sigma-70 factor (ECF subfamily)